MMLEGCRLSKDVYKYFKQNVLHARILLREKIIENPWTDNHMLIFFRFTHFSFEVIGPRFRRGAGAVRENRVVQAHVGWKCRLGRCPCCACRIYPRDRRQFAVRGFAIHGGELIGFDEVLSR